MWKSQLYISQCSNRRNKVKLNWMKTKFKMSLKKPYKQHHIKSPSPQVRVNLLNVKSEESVKKIKNTWESIHQALKGTFF